MQAWFAAVPRPHRALASKRPTGGAAAAANPLLSLFAKANAAASAAAAGGAKLGARGGLQTIDKCDGTGGSAGDERRPGTDLLPTKS